MNDNKLKDNEIIKALECCCKSSHFGECFKNQCPLVSENGCKVGEETLYPYLLDLINRLQAQDKDLAETTHNLTLEKDALFDKAEELKTEVERLNALVKTKNKLIKGLDQSISYAYDRAIEEFANKVTHDINAYCENIRTKPSVDGVTGMKIANDLIYKRLNEMVNENDD